MGLIGIKEATNQAASALLDERPHVRGHAAREME
jgi:hypothetical protein